MTYPRFAETEFSESYTVYYEDAIWTIFKKIKDENYMEDKIKELYGNNVKKLNPDYIYDTYYIKEEEKYHYFFPMPFINYFMILGVNYKAEERGFEDVKFSVICEKHYQEYIRKYLGNTIDIVCV